MKILIVTHYFPPLNSIASLRPYSWAKYWSRIGHDITILTREVPYSKQNLEYDLNELRILKVPFPYGDKGYLSKEKQNLTSTSKLSDATIKSKLISYIHDKGVGDLRFPSSDIFWNKKCISILGDEKWDAAVCTFGGISVLEIGAYLKEKKQVSKLIFDFRDLWTDNHIYKGLFPFTIYEKIREKQLCNIADRITVVSEPLSDILRAKYGAGKVKTILNGFDMDDLLSLSNTPFFSDDKLHIVYTGSIYAGHRDPSPLFEAIRLLKSDGIDLRQLEVLFVGANVSELQSLIDKYRVSDIVKCLGFLSRENSLRMQRDADILLFLEDNKATTDGVLTGKLFEYIFSKTTILCIGKKWLPSRIVEEAKIGNALGNDIGLIVKYLRCILCKCPMKNNLNDVEVEKRFGIYTREYQAEKMLQLIVE